MDSTLIATDIGNAIAKAQIDDQEEVLVTLTNLSIAISVKIDPNFEENMELYSFLLTDSSELKSNGYE